MSDQFAAMLGEVNAVLDRAVAAEDAPGAVCAIAVDGRPIGTVASGFRALIDESGTRIPPAARTGTDSTTRYDLASVTKLFTASAVLKLVELGVLELDAPITGGLPEFRDGVRRAITLRMLLSHTSGLPGVWGGWHDYVTGEGTNAARWQAPPRGQVLSSILKTALAREPASGYEYSCLGYITAMAYAETITGRGWRSLLDETLLAPLDLRTVTFGASPEQSAPTEWQPELGRGLVVGDVHDETAFALGGVSGNAGLFATADELLRFGLAVGPIAPGTSESRVLGQEAFAAFWNDCLPALISAPSWDATSTPDYGQALGPRIGQATWMTDVCGTARGHSGFTGTSLMIDPDRSLVIALLTNRVHPSRSGVDGNAIRSRVTAAVCAELDRA